MFPFDNHDPAIFDFDEGYRDHRRRRSYGPHHGPHLTGDDWSKSRKPTAIDPRYRWVDPHRENRRKEDWPYSYSDHYLWGVGAKGDHAVYSDRLHQWSAENWERAWKAIGQKRFDQFSRDDADKFMSAYLDKPAKVSALAEGCNVSSGYPYWIIWYSEIEAQSVSSHQREEKA